jgi:hypothetical protein
MATKKFTKAELICYVIGFINGPGTRRNILREVHQLSHSSVPFNPTSNSCYFDPTGRSNGGKYSVIVKGLVKQYCKNGNEIVYELTDEGFEVAKQVKCEIDSQDDDDDFDTRPTVPAPPPPEPLVEDDTYAQRYVKTVQDAMNLILETFNRRY